MAKALAVLFAGLAGMAASIQAATNATLASHVRAIPAAFTSFATGTVVLLAITLLNWCGQSPTEILQSYKGVPLWAYAGGLYGAVIVMGMTYAVPVIGVSGAIAVCVTLQLGASLVIDTFGLVGRTALPLTWRQIVGVGLIVLGARLVLWRQ